MSLYVIMHTPAHRRSRPELFTFLTVGCCWCHMPPAGATLNLNIVNLFVIFCRCELAACAIPLQQRQAYRASCDTDKLS
jgi:hypothetical protein